MFFWKKKKAKPVEKKEALCYWSVPDYTPSACIGKYKSKERKTNRLIFMHGVTLPCPDRGRLPLSTDPSDYDLIYNVEAPEEKILKYDVLPENGTAPLVNKRTLALLTELCPGDFQAFPAIIKGEGKGFEPYTCYEYSLINITNQVECINKDEAEFDCLANGIAFGIKTLITNEPQVMGEHHLVRDQSLNSKIFCSPQLVALFKKHKIKGVKFVTDQQHHLK